MRMRIEVYEYANDYEGMGTTNKYEDEGMKLIIQIITSLHTPLPL
jgi:hypothetical protein